MWFLSDLEIRDRIHRADMGLIYITIAGCMFNIFLIMQA